MKIRIGTRESELALWQANFVARNLEAFGHTTEIVKVVSFGDIETDLPIHKIGDKGVFTKALDYSLLMDEVDVAVHSLKDVPTEMHPKLLLAAVPRRGNARDVLVKPIKSKKLASRIVATGSIRRTAMWKHRFPDDEIVGLRGNVPTRIKKVDNNDWYGGIFAHAGLERLGLHFRINNELTWMTPAPAQGAIGVITKNNPEILSIVKKLNHHDTRLCVEIERTFLHRLGAGCSSAVGAYAIVDEDVLKFEAAVLSVDGRDKLSIKRELLMEDVYITLGENFAEELLKKGAQELIEYGTGND